MKGKHIRKMFSSLTKCLVLCAFSVTVNAQLDENCIVNVLNRTIQVSADGGWSLPNIPSNQGNIRARVTCIDPATGVTSSGQTDFFRISENGITYVGDFHFDVTNTPPKSIDFANTTPVLLNSIGADFQLTLTATLSDDSTLDVTNATSGVNYSVTSATVASVSSNGLFSATGNGTALIIARLDGTLTSRVFTVATTGDLDGDGLPDDYETQNGLNPNDPIDALEDQDKDGLSTIAEFNLGTNPNIADTDGDGIEDGEEVIAGSDGFISNPLLADTDGDGLSDGIEILVGSDPNDINDANYTAALVSLSSSPANIVLTFNGIDNEVSTQLNIIGTLIDGSELNLTASIDTTYSSSDLTIVNFGVTQGEIFGGQEGSAVVTVENNGRSVQVPVTVETFEPKGISSLTFSGTGVDTDVQGDYVYIAASSGGLHIVDTNDKENPTIASSFNTTAGALDVKVQGHTAYVAVGTAGLDLVDVSDPMLPVLLANIDTGGSAVDLAIQNGYAFVATQSGGVEIIDVNDATKPISTALIEGIGSIVGVDVSSDRLVMASSTTLYIYDISDINSPIRLGSLNIGNIRAVVTDGEYAYLAAYTSGYKVVNITDPMVPVLVGGQANFYPSDVELTNGFAFFSDILFVNAVPFVNLSDREQPIYQGAIDIRQFGDRDATGLSLDSSYVYSTGSNRLYISQYRLINDNQGIAPQVAIDYPLDNAVVVEGRRFIARATATDDIAVQAVNFMLDGAVIFSDTTAPYEVPVTVTGATETVELSASAVDLGNNSSQAIVTLRVEPDTDGDGLGDGEEVDRYATDPLLADTDEDGLNDGEEVAIGSNPLVKDTDSDGIEDKTEVDAGTDPTNPDITPPTVLTTDPVSESTDIAENTSVSVVFSEPLRSKSVNEGSLILLADSGGTFEIPGILRLVSNNTELLFTPNSLLPDFTTHTIQISGVRDEAGNPIVDFEASFETGNFVDTVRPTVIDSNPVANATNVPVNIQPIALLSEPIDPDTVSPTSFYLQDTLLNQRVEGVIVLADDKSSLTFVPNTQLLVGRRYYMYLTSGIKDLFGNTLPATIKYFTTGFSPDIQAPQISHTTIFDGQDNVPTNVRLKISFSEAINPLSMQNIRLVDNIGEPVFVNRSLSSNRMTVTLQPGSPLQGNTSYQLQIDSIEDLAGNLTPSSIFIDFTTAIGADTTAGTLISRNIPNGATNIPRDAEFEVTLSERLDPASVQLGTNSFRLYDTTTGLSVPSSFSLSADGMTLTLIPDGLLVANRLYYWYVGYSPYLYDMANNFIALNNFSSFTTGAQTDDVAPLLVNTNILNNALEVPVNARVVLTLNEPLGSNCLTQLLITDGVDDVAFASVLSSDRRTLTLTPSAALAANTIYQVEFTGLCDYAGNSLSGQALSFTTSTTGASDTVRPVLQSVVPANNAVGVLVDTNVVITFDETISLRSSVLFYNSDTNQRVLGRVDVTDNVLTFTPDELLRGGTRYRTEIRWNVFDLVGNQNYYGDYYFTTEAVEDNQPPTVTMISPQQDSVDINPNGNIVINFSEPMNPNTVNSNNIALFVNGAVVRPSVFKSADGRQVTLSANKPWSSLISVIMTDDVLDLSGNALAPYVSTFMTGILDNDTGRPSISRQIPTNGSSGWIGLDELLLYTSEPMDASSIDDAFHITEDGVLIDAQGTLEVLGDGRTIRFTKDTPFTENRYVQIFLSSAATDDSGNPLNNYNAYFRTGVSGDLVGTRPNISAYYPGNNQTGVPVNPQLFVLYTEALDSATLTSANVKLQNVDNGFSDVPSTASFDVSSNLLKVVPDADLDADTRYYLWLSGNIEDTDGDRQNSNRATYFYTAVDGSRDDRQPTVLAQSPTSGQSNVGVNTMYASRYDENMNPLTFDYGTGSQRRFNAQFSENNQVVRYERLGTLPELTEITEAVPAMVDLAGNPVVPRDTTFTSANGPDIVNPTRILISVNNGATNVSTNPVIESLFNEPIDPVSITSAIRLYDTITGLNVPSSVALSADGLRLTMVPNEALLVSRTYYVYVYGLRDLSGNGVVNFFSTFITSFVSDNERPTFVDSTIFDGITDVPTNIWIRVRFDEPLNPLELSGVMLEDNIGGAIPSNINLSTDRKTVYIVPKNLLTTDSNYRLTVDGLKDISGNDLLIPVVQNFTTTDSPDLLQGSLLYRNIPNGATNIPRDAEFEVTLSERLDPASVQLGTNSFRLYDTTTGLSVPSSFSLSADGMTLTLIPDGLLVANRLYYWYVGYSPYLYDMANNFIALNNFSSFTTGAQTDDVAPLLVNTNILNNALEVPVNARVVLTLNEPLGSNCLTQLLITDGVDDVAFASVLSSDRRTLTLTPSAALAANTIYQVEFTGLCDYAGNSLSGQALSFTTSTTGASDTVRPVLQSVVPANNAVGVLVDTNVVITFDETISLRSSVLFYNSDTNQRVLGRVDVTDNVLTFTPDELLRGGTRYRTEIRWNVFDLVGNQNYYGDYYFTTEAVEDNQPPTVTMISPQQDSVDINPNGNIVINFSEPMNPNTVNSNNIALFVNGAVVRPSVFKSADGRQVTLSANKPWSSLISVIMTDDVLDLSGNALAPYVSTFMTGILDNDTGRPSISRQIPTNGSSGWIGLDELLLYTSEPMDASSIDDAFHITEDGVLIDAQGTLEVLGDGRTIRFTKDTPFTENRYVQIFLSSAATDDSGNPLNNYNAYFRTGVSGDLVGTRPNISAYYPGNNQTGVPVNPQLFVLYTEALDSATLTSANVKLQNVDNGFSDVPSTASFDVSSNLLKVVPDADLDADTRYYLWLSGNIEDTDGDRQNSNRATYFYTAVDGSRDDRQPTVLAQSPTSGQSNVGVNTMYASRYDENMNPLTFDYGTGSQRRFNAQFSENNQVVRYERLGTLPELTEITEAVPAMVDLAGNPVVPRDTTFTSANGPDIVNPTRILISVNNGATNVSTNPVIESLFNEPIDPVSITSAIRLYDTITGLNVPSSVALSADGLRLTMVPNEALLVSRTYYVYVYGLRDLSGNGVVNFFSTFITGASEDSAGPELVDSTLFDGITDVPTNVWIRIRFDEPLSVLELAGVIIEDSIGESVVVNVSLSGDRRTINVVPKNLLDTSSNYSLIVANITDISGNLLSTSITQGFNTGSSTDLLAGSETYRSIPNAVTNVPRNAAFEVGLNERLDPASVQPGTNSFRLYDTTTRQSVASSFSVSADGKTLGLTPDALLEASRVYYWYVGYSPYLYDLANNFIALNQFSSFTTGVQVDNTPPVLLSSNIVEGETNIPVNPDIILTLNEPLGNLCYLEVNLTDGLSDIVTLISLSTDRKILTVQPSYNLDTNTAYTVELTGLCDYADNTLSGDALHFTTGNDASADLTKPTITSITPVSNGTGVGVGTNIVIVFSETIGANNVVRLFNAAGQLVPGVVSIAGDQLTFNPDASLANNNRHRIEIRWNIFDLAGNQNYFGDSYFTTEL
jgi:hypothetical protein